MKKIRIYTDESGNSGSNLFDKDQPNFWTGTLISERDFDKKYGNIINNLCAQLKVDELHANDLGISKINSISKELTRIVTDKKLKFLFTKIDKIFSMKLQMFDYIYDNGLNRAVSGTYYSIRGLRISLAYYFTYFVNEKIAKRFWEYYSKPESKEFISIYTEVLKLINDPNEANARGIRYDSRATELISDTIKWAVENPSSFLNYRRIKVNMPNITSIVERRITTGTNDTLFYRFNSSKQHIITGTTDSNL